MIWHGRMGVTWADAPGESLPFDSSSVNSSSVVLAVVAVASSSFCELVLAVLLGVITVLSSSSSTLRMENGLPSTALGVGVDTG